MKARKAVVVLFFLLGCCGASARVVLISVDGLYGELLNTLSEDQVPNLIMLASSGVSTSAAYADPSLTRTLPNHVSMVTGRFVQQQFNGHCWTDNETSQSSDTVHDNCGSYVESIFDVAHDNGLSTALFATKEKFVLFQQSWGLQGGRPDLIGEDNGNNKLDRFEIRTNPDELFELFLMDLKFSKRDLYFVHLRNPDSAGHKFGWEFSNLESEYHDSLKATDRYFESLLELIYSDSNLSDTTLIITADHGGQPNAKDHPTSAPESHQIPFIVWWQNATSGNLYDNVEEHISQPPIGSIIPANASIQPIRNRDAANLTLACLKIASISAGSQSINLFKAHHTSDAVIRALPSIVEFLIDEIAY